MLKESLRAAAKSPMALEEERSSAAQELRRAIDCLMSSAELQDVAPGILEMLAAGAVHFSLPSNSVFAANCLLAFRLLPKYAREARKGASSGNTRILNFT